MAMSYLDYRIKHRQHQNERGEGKPAAPAVGKQARGSSPASSDAVKSSASSSGTGSSFLDYKVKNRKKEVKANGYEHYGTYSYKAPEPFNPFNPESLNPTNRALWELSEQMTGVKRGQSLGQYGRGNIDLYDRPQYRNPDGSISTVRSMSFGDESGKEILVPTIGRDAKGRPVQLTEDEAIDRYYRTGQHLGKFDSIEDADNYAEQLHQQQDAYYRRPSASALNQLGGLPGAVQNAQYQAYQQHQNDEREKARQKLEEIALGAVRAQREEERRKEEAKDMRPSYMKQQGQAAIPQDQTSREDLEDVWRNGSRNEGARNRAVTMEELEDSIRSGRSRGADKFAQDVERGKAVTRNELDLSDEEILRRAAGGNASAGTEMATARLSQEEKENYYYIAATQGKKQAENYRQRLIEQNGINADIAKENYDAMKRARGEKSGLKDIPFDTAVQWTLGAGQAIDAMSRVPEAIAGETNYRATSAGQMLSQNMINDIDTSRVSGKAYRLWNELANNIGTNTPSIVAGAMFAPIAGSTMFAAQAAGDAYQEVINEGGTVEQAQSYAAMQAVDETITNALLGGIEARGGGLIKDALGNIGAARRVSGALRGMFINNPVGLSIAEGFMDMLANGGSEAAQEYLQYYTERFEKWLATGQTPTFTVDNKDYTFQELMQERGYAGALAAVLGNEEAKKSALLGFLNAGVMNGSGNLAAASNRLQAGMMASPEAYAGLADQVDPNITHYRSEDTYQTGKKLMELARDQVRRAEAGRENSLSSIYGRGMMLETYDDYQRAVADTEMQDLTEEEQKQRQEILDRNARIEGRNLIGPEKALDRMNRIRSTIAGENVQAQEAVEDTGAYEVTLPAEMKEDALYDLMNTRNAQQISWDTAQGEVSITREEDGSYAFTNERGETVTMEADQAAELVPAEQELRVQNSTENVTQNAPETSESSETVRDTAETVGNTAETAENNYKTVANTTENVGNTAGIVANKTETAVRPAQTAEAVDRTAAAAVEIAKRAAAPATFRERMQSAMNRNAERTAVQADEETMSNLASGYDAAGAKAFREMYRGERLDGYTRAFSAAYNSGRHGMKMSDLGAITALLSEDQLKEAFKAGVEDGKAANESILNAEPYKQRQKNHSGGVNLEASIPDARIKHRGLVNTLDKLGKKTGIIFVIADSANYENDMLGKTGAAGGYRNGVIVVDVSNTKNILATITHEMTHWLKEQDPFTYMSFRDAAVSSLQRNPDFDFEATLDQYRKAYKDLSREDLMEEIVSDSTGTFLNDEAFMNEVLEGNRTIGQRILDWLNAVCDAIKDMISLKGLSRSAYALKKDLKTYEEIRDMWMAGVEAAAKNQTENGYEADGQTVKYSRLIKEGMSPEERYNILKNETIKIVEYDPEILPKTGADLVALEKKSFKEANAEARRIAKKLGIIRKGYRTPDLEIEFRYSGNNVVESLNKQRLVEIHGRFLAYAKMLTCFDEILQNAQLIESHKDRYEGEKREDKELRNVHVLVSAFTDGNNIQPVKLEIKEFDTAREGKENGLYVAIAMPKIIEADALEDRVRSTHEGSPVTQASASIIRLADLLGEIKKNPSSEALGKYIPEQFAKDLDEIPVKHQLNLGEPVEQTKDLIAMHNLTENKLKSLLQYEGIPMPSIAVTKVDIGHENFGGISFVFRKDTIDPKNKKNKVFSADAWTPTFPRIEYQADAKAETRIREKYYKLEEKYGRQIADALYSYGNVLEEQMNRYEGAAGIIEKESENTKMVQAYLYDIGRGEEIPKAETVETETREPMSEKSISLGTYIIDQIGKEAFEEGSVKLRDIREAYRKNLMEERHFPEDEADAEIRKRGTFFFERLSRIAEDVANGRTEIVRKSTKTDSTKRDAFLRKEMATEGYKNWLQDLFGGVEKSKGLYNGKDLYTNSGSRRSFKATHYDVTAANIVKAMLSQNDGRNQNAGGFTAGIKSLRSSAADRFRSIKDIKRAAVNLKDTDSATYQELLDGLSTRLYDQIQEIKHDVNSFFETDNIGEILIEAIDDRKTSVPNLKAVYKKYGYDLTDEQAQKFSDLVEDVRNMPVNMFEAKPERVVGWDEIAAAVMPDTTSAETIAALRAHGVSDIRMYEEGNEAERKQIISGMDDVKFQKNVDEAAADTRRTWITWTPDLQHAVHELTDVLTAYEALAPTEQEIRRSTRDIVKKFGSSVDVDRVAQQIESLYRYLAQGGRPDGQQVMDVAGEIANEILDEATHSDPEIEKRWKDFKKEMRKRRIYIPADRVADLNPDGLKALRKIWNGKMLFTTDEKYRERYGNIQYQELQQLFPEYFTRPAEDLANDIDAIEEIMLAFDTQAPIYEKIYKGATRDEAALELSYDIMQGYFGNDRAAARFKKIYRDYVKPIKEAAILEYQEQLRNIQIKDAARLEQRTFFDRIKGLDKAYIVSESALKDSHIQERKAMMERIREKQELERQKYQERIEKNRLGYIDRKDKDRLFSLANQLSKMKGGPEFEQKKRELIGDLDLVAKGISTGTELKLLHLRQEYEQLQAEDPTVELDRATEKALERLDKKHIASMTSDEIRQLIQAIVKVREDQWNHNRLIREEDNALVSDKGRAWISDTRGLRKGDSKKIKEMIDAGVMAHLNSKRAFRMLSGYQNNSVLMDLWNELNEGQHKQMDFQRRSESLFQDVIRDPANQEFVKGLFQPTVEITSSEIKLKDKYGNVKKVIPPQKATITPAMKISLYLHSLNRDNREHIEYGGIRVPNMQKYAAGEYGESYGYGSTIIRLNKADLQKIAESLTPSEKAFADAAYKYFNEISKEAINEVSLKLDGFERAIVEDYFPVKADPNFTKREMSGLMQDGTIQGMGFLKERNFHANNPIYLEDITQVLERSMRDTGLYYGLAIPVRNFNKVYNWEAPNQEDTVKEAIMQTWGQKGNAYIEKVLRDLQGGDHKTKDSTGQAVDKFTSLLRGNYAGAVLTLNPSVAIKQAASFPTAAAKLGWEPLAKALHKITTATDEDMETINKYTPLLWYRAQGQSSDALAEVAKRKSPWKYDQKVEAVRQKMNWIQNIDVKTVKTLWYASEYFVQENNKDLAPGSELYYKEVAKVFNAVVEDTQPNYTTLQRASISRADNEIMKAVFMFKTQPLQNIGILYDSFMEYKKAHDTVKRMIKYGNTENMENALQELAVARKAWMHGASAILVSTAVFSAMTLAAAALLHRMDPFRDPETGNITPASVIKKFFNNAAESMAGMVLGGGEIYSLIMSMTTGSYMDDISVSGIDTLNETINNIKNLYDTVGKTLENEKKTPEEKALAIGKSAKKLAYNITQLFGIPLNNASKIAESMVNHYTDIVVNGDPLSFDSGAKLTKKQQAYRAVEAFRKGDTEKGSEALESTTKKYLEEALGTKISTNLYEAFLSDGKNLEAFLNMDPSRELDLSDVPDHGYSSFTKLREGIGDPKRNEQWHHIVEQEQGPGEKNFGTFKATEINNVNNIVSIPSSSNSVHSEITKYYGTVQDFTNGKTVREWLRDKSFEEQFEFGIEQLRKYGDLLPTENGWIFVPNDQKIEELIPRKKGNEAEKTETQRRWETSIAEAREDKSLTDREIRDVAIQMLAEDVPVEEAMDLYKGQKKNDKYLEKWDGSFEEYLDARNKMEEAKSIKDTDVKRETVKTYLRNNNWSEEDELMLWKLAGFGESTFEYE